MSDDDKKPDVVIELRESRAQPSDVDFVIEYFLTRGGCIDCARGGCFRLNELRVLSGALYNLIASKGYSLKPPASEVNLDGKRILLTTPKEAYLDSPYGYYKKPVRKNVLQYVKIQLRARGLEVRIR